MKTKVGLKGVTFFAFHGYYPEERKKGNEFVIDIEVELKSFDSLDDNITDTVNYESLYQICDEEMALTQKLLETVVFRIIQKLKERHPGITSGEVKLEKMAPPLNGKVEKAVVQMSF